MASTFTYHVSCATSSRKKLVTVAQKDDLTNKIQSVFGITSHVIVQKPFEDDWIDVDDCLQLADSGKLRFVTLQTTNEGEHFDTCFA